MAIYIGTNRGTKVHLYQSAEAPKTHQPNAECGAWVGLKSRWGSGPLRNERVGFQEWDGQEASDLCKRCLKGVRGERLNSVGFNGRNRGTAVCYQCKKRTWRERVDVGSTDLCDDCFEAAGLENQHSDTDGKHYGDGPVANCPACQGG